MQNLSIDNWTLNLIIANTKAIENNVRYIDSDLNRAFWTEIEEWNEKEVAREVQPYLEASDFLLDLHNTVNNKSPRFTICTDDTFLKTFNVAYATTWMSEMHQGSTDIFMKQIWKSAVCLECWRVKSKNNIFNETIKDVNNFLWKVGILNTQNIKEFETKTIHFDGMYTTKENLQLTRKYQDFEFLKKWHKVWVDGNTDVLFPYDWYITFAADQEGSDQEGFLYWKGMQ